MADPTTVGVTTRLGAGWWSRGALCFGDPVVIRRRICG